MSLLALHFAGAGTLNRLQIVGVGGLHIWGSSWNITWSLDLNKLARNQVLRAQSPGAHAH